MPELRQYLVILRRRIWAVITVLVIIATVGTVHAFKATPVYRAQARLLIEKQTPRVMDFQDVMQLETSDRTYFNTQAQLILSRAVLEKALARPAVKRLFETEGDAAARRSLFEELRRTVAAVMGTPVAAPPEPWQRMRSILAVEQVRDTHLLQVSVESADPKAAADVANGVASAFEQYHLEHKMAVSDEAFRFLRDQTAIQEKKVIEAADALQDFREQVRAVSLDGADGQNPVSARLTRLSQELTEAQVRRIALEAEWEVVREALQSDAGKPAYENSRLFALPAVRDDLTVNAIRASLVDVEKDVMGLSDTYGPGHPQLQAAQAKASLLRTKLAEALGQVADSLAPRLEILAGRERELQAHYDGQNQLALAMAKHSLTYGRLQGEASRQSRLFEVLVERMREVDLASDYAKTNVKLVESAQAPTLPVRPRKARLMLMTLLLGLSAGVGLAFLLEHLDDTVKTPEDLEDRVGVPVLGFVPAMNHRAGETTGFAHRGTVYLTDPTSSASESYRNIRTSLFFAAPADQTKTVVVTSGGPRDGKTTTATNLALAIAQSGKRVLLVDADLRRPMLHKVFDLSGQQGLSTVLVGQSCLEEAVQAPRQNGRPVDGLHVLAAGPRPPNPAELLDSDQMHELLSVARERYDRVIIDTPPVLFVADASILAGACDGVIMVVKCGKNSRALAARAREQLESVRAHVLGGILNEVHMSRLGYYYSDYYYGYSRYYRDYYGSRETTEQHDEETARSA